MGMDRLSTIVFLLVAAMHGCSGFRPPTFHSAGNCTVVLDWTGGDNPLWTGDGDLPPLDLGEFPLAWTDSDTLADVPGFKEMVRAEIEKVLTASGLHVTVEEGEQRSMVSVVHFSLVVDPDRPDELLGFGHLDTCNISDEDFSIVFAAAFLDLLGRGFDADEWVRVFANVAAHEIAHNLGFGHVEPEDVPESEFVELMLAEQTTFQRVMEQRILVEQDTCAFGMSLEIDDVVERGSDLDREELLEETR